MSGGDLVAMAVIAVAVVIVIIFADGSHNDRRKK